jgi:hypothetical protein
MLDKLLSLVEKRHRELEPWKPFTLDSVTPALDLVPPDHSPVRIIRLADGSPCVEVLRADGTWAGGLLVGFGEARTLEQLVLAYRRDPQQNVSTRHLREATGLKAPERMLHHLRRDHEELHAVIVPPGKKRRGGGWRLRQPAGG